ncbi:HAD-IA family hydrolase [Nevskia sp.]|uniref:HAD-IA family hydrolase n=1 Tax=Nevskia sp. TaxID=1929292 RepID=UPI0025EC49AF|nr:HAD-IA family hydrolase [Nevskia sp.]
MTVIATDRPFDAVLFDLDGTLLETAPEIAAAVNLSIIDQGLPPADTDAVRFFIGHGVRQTIAKAYDTVSLTGTTAEKREADIDAALIRFEHHYGRLAPLSQPFADTVSTLVSLRAAGVKCAIVSNKETRFVEQLLADGPLPALIDLVVCGDTLAQKKPDAAPALHAMAAFGSSRERTLLVGDSSIDVACARNAGITVWMVPYGYNGGHPAAEAGADRVINTLTEVAHACSGTGAVSVNLANGFPSAPHTP